MVAIIILIVYDLYRGDVSFPLSISTGGVSGKWTGSPFPVHINIRTACWQEAFMRKKRNTWSVPGGSNRKRGKRSNTRKNKMDTGRIGNAFTNAWLFLKSVSRRAYFTIGYYMTHDLGTVALVMGAAGLGLSFIGVGCIFSAVSLFFSLRSIRKGRCDYVKVLAALGLAFAGIFISLYCIVYLFICLSIGESVLARKLF